MHHLNILKIVLFFTILVICILFIGIYSSSETALNSINLIRFNTILQREQRGKKKGNKFRRKIIKSLKIRLLLKEYMTTISSIAIVSNILAITAATMSVFFFSQIIQSNTTAEYVSWGVLTVVIIIFGEVIPKFIGRNWPEQTVVALFYFYFFSYWFFAPLLKSLDHVLEIKKRSFVTRDELIVILSKMRAEGMISAAEQKLCENALRFEKKSVRNIFIHKDQVIFINKHQLTCSNLEFIYKIYMLNLLPVIDQQTGRFVAFFNYKIYLNLLITYQHKQITEKLIFDKCLEHPGLIRRSTSLVEAFSKISKSKNRVVAVVDDYVNLEFKGILNAELLLSSVMNRQFAVTSKFENFLYQQINTNTYLVNSKCDLRLVFSHILNISDSTPKYKTINQFLIQLNGGKIHKFESVFFKNYQFKKYWTNIGNSFYEVTRLDIIPNRTIL